MQKEKVTISDFYRHKFAEIGEASIAIFRERVLISVTDAANLVRKDRKHLVKWLLINRIAMMHFHQINDSLTAIFFDDFIKFCLDERDTVDNYNAAMFLTHLVEKEIVS